ncbi:MAG TPA: superoxide dismutase [Propionibacteriaceae bacterium]|nr:superoxide dismutase [Propionibacteriaceae bacterium]
MIQRSRLRLLLAGVLSALLGLALVAPAEAKPRHAYPDRIDLPIGFQPEGITIKGSYAYVGSLADGDIYRADLRTGEGVVISEGPGTPSVGLKIDKSGLLYVAGGPAGTARVVDSRTGELLADYTLSTEPSFINDVVLTKRYAWFTNSQQPELYRVPLGGDPEATPVVVPLTGDWVQQAGFNANGIAVTPDGRALLVVQSATGLLFRVNPVSGEATRVDLGGYRLTNGDGLLVRGQTLYVVQNRLEQVAVFKLKRRGTVGALVKVLPVPDSDVPTTVAAAKGSLYVPNARFGIATPETQEYWITRIHK